MNCLVTDGGRCGPREWLENGIYSVLLEQQKQCGISISREIEPKLFLNSANEKSVAKEVCVCALTMGIVSERRKKVLYLTYACA